MPAITEENETQLRIESTMSLSTQQTDVKSRIHIISLVYWIARHTLNSLLHVGDKDAYHESDNSNPSSSPSSKLETKSVSTFDDPIGLHNVKSEYICGAKETKIKTKIRLGSYGFQRIKFLQRCNIPCVTDEYKSDKVESSDTDIGLNTVSDDKSSVLSASNNNIVSNI